jgi:hypothetical protein
MVANVIVWDIETVPDIKSFAAANGHDGKSDDEIRVAMGDKFPKHIYHSIICIGALVAHQEDSRWTVDALGAPHAGALDFWNFRETWRGRVDENKLCPGTTCRLYWFQRNLCEVANAA